jgi:diguanylate cyclase (GGDEF)-like protein
VTLSAGIAAYRPGVERADQLLQEADAALYRAKADGRNRICLSR